MNYREQRTQANLTVMMEFILLGFSDLPDHQEILFGIFLFIYISILLGNSLIIVITKVELALQTPMYFFIRNLSFVEICYTSVILPRILVNLWTQKRNLSLLACAVQLCFFLILGVTESYLLTIMAYDRYVAICKPLYYPVIMIPKLCVQMVIGCWTGGIPIIIWQTHQIFSLPFCHSNKLNHIFCEMPPLMKLACGDISGYKYFIYVDLILFGLIPFMLIIFSYTRILIIILKFPSITGRYKAFSTCSSHLMVVILFYVSAGTAYLKSKSSNRTDKVFTLIYTMVTPMFNPMIYSLRNKDFIAAMKKILSKCVMSGSK